MVVVTSSATSLYIAATDSYCLHCLRASFRAVGTDLLRARNLGQEHSTCMRIEWLQSTDFQWAVVVIVIWDAHHGG